MFRFGFKSGRGRLPRQDLLIYLARPNSDEYLIGEDTETGEDTYIWGYVLPDDADIRAATGWVSGTANVFYTATGVPIVALATEIAASEGINVWNILFLLTDANNQIGRLAIYDPDAALSAVDKARRYMHLPLSTALAVDDSVVLVNDDVLTVV